MNEKEIPNENEMKNEPFEAAGRCFELPGWPDVKEEKYVGWDEETQMWCVFGVDSGYAYGTYTDEGEAIGAADDSDDSDKADVFYLIR